MTKALEEWQEISAQLYSFARDARNMAALTFMTQSAAEIQTTFCTEARVHQLLAAEYSRIGRHNYDMQYKWQASDTEIQP